MVKNRSPKEPKAAKEAKSSDEETSNEPKPALTPGELPAVSKSTPRDDDSQRPEDVSVKKTTKKPKHWRKCPRCRYQTYLDTIKDCPFHKGAVLQTI